jgi:hypothetical protein
VYGQGKGKCATAHSGRVSAEEWHQSGGANITYCLEDYQSKTNELELDKKTLVDFSKYMTEEINRSAANKINN